jgi:TonB-dependent SusC/RagA subfamily outer membrane receptor
MGGVSTLDAEQAREDRPVARLSDLLKGRVAGVEVRTGPGGRIIVRIRGTTSINGSNAPLYVVDGKAVKAAPGGALPSVNPYAVESIRVLKGPAASAYGSRGANGVIVVTTKDGD